MNSLFKKILTSRELIEKPPVLIDIGASGFLHPKWKEFAEYSICIAFDADNRELKFIEEETKNFKKLITYNCIVSDFDNENEKFYLTESPFCSSMLRPDTESLENFIYSKSFEINKIINVKTMSLSAVLKEQNIDRVDWFKSDSQGIDLRLFKNIPENIRRRIIAAEFEPGIIDAYIGEDKLSTILEYMTANNFWLSDIVIKGSARISRELFEEVFKSKLKRRIAKEMLKPAPGWGEMTFFNSINQNIFGKRETLLMWLFTTLEGHHSYALRTAGFGRENFSDSIFQEMFDFSRHRLNRELFGFKLIQKSFLKLKESFLG